MKDVDRSLIRNYMFDDLAEFGLKNYIHHLERQIIVYYLNRYNDSTADVAKQLGIERTTLHMKRKKFGLINETQRAISS